MNLYIMTRGREGKQITLSHLPDEWKKKTYLVCPAYEQHEHTKRLNPPPWVVDYSTKMQYLIEYIREVDGGKGVIMDDDLWFDLRVLGEEKLQKPQHPDQLCDLFDYMEELLETTALVGIHPRQMGHNKALPYVENGKVICVQGINTNLLPEDMPRIDHYPILSDVWLNCHLLSRGIGNKLITTFVQDHASCQAPGGCSIYRTPEMQKRCCEALEEAFAPHFKMVVKRPKSAQWMGGERYDFRVQWKRMYEEGRSKRGL